MLLPEYREIHAKQNSSSSKGKRSNSLIDIKFTFKGKYLHIVYDFMVQIYALTITLVLTNQQRVNQRVLFYLMVLTN